MLETCRCLRLALEALCRLRNADLIGMKDLNRNLIADKQACPTVYRGTRLLIGDQVAIKVLHADQVGVSQAAERFQREAQAAARLKHPNAVSVYDFGVSKEGLFFLVMELVDGESVRAMIRRRGTF